MRCKACGQKIRSRISLMRVKLGTQPAKREKGTYWRDGHEYLYGVQAHFWRRLEIYRMAGGDISLIDGTFEHVEDLRPGMCQGCAETHPVGWYEGEWNHTTKSYGGRRCDCAACGQWVCKAYHARYHNRVVKWRGSADRNL